VWQQYPLSKWYGEVQLEQVFSYILVQFKQLTWQHLFVLKTKGDWHELHYVSSIPVQSLQLAWQHLFVALMIKGDKHELH
jgi:hypothetical protein